MSRKINDHKDYLEFIQTLEEAAPETLSEQIREEIKDHFKINLPQLIFTLLTAQLIVGLVSMLFCSQFGRGGLVIDLSSYFHHWGLSFWCPVFCAFIYSAATFLLVSFILPLHVLTFLRRHFWYSALLLPVLALGVFIFIGEQQTLTYLVLWSLTSMGLHLFNLFTVSGLRLRLHRA